MKHIFKKLSMLAVAAVMCCSLAACGKGGGTDKDGNVIVQMSLMNSTNENPGWLAMIDAANGVLERDGEKVRIVKDGQELDVYGDGYYREGTGADEGSMWYVPGYYNFPADESIKKARVCIAAAAEPVIYTEGAYGKGGSRQYDNALYWLNYNCLSSRKALFREAVCLTIGIGLLLLSLLFRKSRREALTGIAGFQGKIWVEAKVLLLFGALCAEAFIMIRSSYEYGGYGLWEEIVVAYDYE